MTRAEALRRIGELHTAWSLQHGDTVPYVKADENPHDGQTTDLALWQADRSAPAEIDDPLNEAIKNILAQIDEELQAQARSLRLPELRHLPGKHDQSTHGHGGGGVRDSLAGAGTTQEIGAAASAEAKRITGRDIPFDYQDIEPQLAREYSEGVLQGLERFPSAPLGAVRAKDFPAERESEFTWAHTLPPESTGGQYEIEFNRSGEASERLNEILGMKQARGVFAYGDVRGLALHEFGHVMHESRGTSSRASELGRTYARERTARAPAPAPRRGLFGRRPPPVTGPTQEEREDQRVFLLREISFYSQHNSHEFAAEAFADVMVRGAGASPLSHQVMDLLEVAQ